MLVRFVRRTPPYNAGEVAGFKEDEARRFIRIGAAVEEKPMSYVDRRAPEPVTRKPAAVDVPNLPTDGLPTYVEQPRRRGRARKNADT